MSSRLGDKIGIKRSTRLENAIAQMQEFAHESNNELKASHAACLQAGGKSGQDRVMTLGDNSRHVQGGTQGSAATLGNVAGFVNGRAGNVLTGIETSEGNQLTDVVKVRDGAQFGQELASGQVADAWNRGQQVALTLQVRML